MSGIVLILAMAVTTEGLVEYGKSLAKAFCGQNKWVVIKQFCAMAICVGLCFAARADLFGELGINLQIPWVGVVITGIIGSRGANYVSDFLGKIQKTRTEETSIFE